LKKKGSVSNIGIEKIENGFIVNIFEGEKNIKFVKMTIDGVIRLIEESFGERIVKTKETKVKKEETIKVENDQEIL
jgi:hypothetical protein